MLSARAGSTPPVAVAWADEAPDAERVWQGLMRGQWSLLEALEADDGRRFVIARRNTSVAPGPDGLTSLESEVAPLAAHPDELTDTVSTGVSHGSRKLKIAGRIELVRQIGSRGQLQLTAAEAQVERHNIGNAPGDDQQASTIPLPEGARVTHLGPFIAVLEFWVASMMLPPGLTEAEQEVALLLFEGASAKETY